MGVTYGHTKGAVSDELAPVENEDVATFTATFDNGAVGTFSASRVAHNLPDGLGFELFASKGSAAWELHRPGEFQISTAESPRRTRRTSPGAHRARSSIYPRRTADGRRRRRARRRRPVRYQTRAFLDQIADRSSEARGEGTVGDMGPLPGFEVGLHGLQVVAAVTESAKDGGLAVKVL